MRKLAVCVPVRTALKAGVAIVSTVAAVSALSLVPGGAADGATSPLTMTVTLSTEPAILQGGAVNVVAWTTCSTGLTAYEFDVSVSQGGSFGSTIQRTRDVVPCDDTAHRSVVRVPADIGAFVAGAATISAYFSGNNGGGDIEATDEVTVPLRPVWRPATVHVRDRPIRLDAAHAVRVVFWYRCAAKYQAFELDVSVTQGDSASALTVLGPPAVVTCDGTRHRMVKTLASPEVRFHRGPAVISVFLGLYDTVQDHDADVSDEATVWLMRPLA
jgi:hypothetical protein